MNLLNEIQYYLSDWKWKIAYNLLVGHKSSNLKVFCGLGIGQNYTTSVKDKKGVYTNENSGIS